MMKILIQMFLIILSLTSISAADRIRTEKDLDNFLHTYYLNPNPDLVTQAIIFLGKKKKIRINAIPPIVGFFNQVFHNNEKYKELGNLIRVNPDLAELEPF